LSVVALGVELSVVALGEVLWGNIVEEDAEGHCSTVLELASVEQRTLVGATVTGKLLALAVDIDTHKDLPVSNRAAASLIVELVGLVLLQALVMELGHHRQQVA
jgi:hypothetical protein